MRISNMLAVAVALALPASVLAQQTPSPLSPPDEPGTALDRRESASQQPGDIVDDGMVDDVDNPEIPKQPLDEPASAPQRPTEREAGYRGATPPAMDSNRQNGSDRNLDADQSQGNQEMVNYLAAKLYLTNQSQAELADFAAQQADHEDVKKFAEQVRDDHQALNRQLKQAMPGMKTIDAVDSAGDTRATVTTPRPRATVDSGDATDVLPDGTADLNTPRTRTAGNLRSTQNAQDRGTEGQMATSQGRDILDGSAQKLLDLQRKAIETNHEMTQQMLSEKQGKEFDRCFVASQMGTKMWLHAELQALNGVGSQQFTEIVQQADSKVEQHLDTAKRLAEELKQSQGESNSSQGPSSNSQVPDIDIEAPESN